VPLGEVQEIIRMPELVQVPLCAPSLEGIANLRGVVLPVTSLRRVFGTEVADHDDATRVVVVNRAGAPVGFVVDRMASVITAETSEIEGAETLQGSLHGDLLRGVVKRASGLIMLLDPARLAAADLRGEGRTGNGHGLATAGMAAERTERGQAATADDMQLVSFEAAGQEYAFPIEDVQEIVQVPATLTQVPQAKPQVVGVMTLRERLLPLVSLRRMFALPGATVDEHSRIVVVSAGGAGSVGIVMDKVKEVLRVSRALIDPVPAMLAGGDDGGPNAFEAICRLNGGKRLVTILSAARIFRDAALRGALATATGIESGQEDSMAGETGSGGAAATFDEEQFVVFRLAGEEYGVPIDSVQEIVRVPDELTHVPKAASFMEGVVNLRGTVLPVVDQRRRFALAEAERNDRQRIMVLTIAGVRTGFIVDQVSEVLKIPRALIEPAPVLSEEQARLIRRVANLEAQKQMILLLDPANLLAAGEVAAIGAM
jgi:purine-binding chemotaxis protein CheW